jgi:hypothetical protein
MIEVFKTNVSDRPHAIRVIELIQRNFIGYKANFDLEDCDKILRVKSTVGPVQSSLLIDLLRAQGYAAEVLTDELPVEIKPATVC